MKRAFVCALALAVAGCGKPDDKIRAKVEALGTDILRRESGRLNRDYFAVPGHESVSVKQSLWTKTFAAMKPLRITVYRDGSALAFGGAAGSTEWGLFVVPTGLNYTPPSTETIRYELIRDGVFIYRNIP